MFASLDDVDVKEIVGEGGIYILTLPFHEKVWPKPNCELFILDFLLSLERNIGISEVPNAWSEAK